MNTTHKNITQVYKGGEGIDIKLDAHCWIELDGKVYDYDDSILEKCSFFGTKNIVRKEFPVDLQLKCLPYVLDVVEAKLKEADEMGIQEHALNHWVNNAGNCFCRALLLNTRCKQEGLKSKIKIGSLGFVQKNNKDIFYEYG